MAFSDYMLIVVAGAISVATIALVGIKNSIDRLAMEIRHSGARAEAEEKGGS